MRSRAVLWCIGKGIYLYYTYRGIVCYICTFLYVRRKSILSGDVLFTLPNIISHSSGLNRNRTCACIFGLCCICSDLNMSAYPPFYANDWAIHVKPNNDNKFKSFFFVTFFLLWWIALFSIMPRRMVLYIPLFNSIHHIMVLFEFNMGWRCSHSYFLRKSIMRRICCHTLLIQLFINKVCVSTTAMSYLAGGGTIFFFLPCFVSSSLYAYVYTLFIVLCYFANVNK